ncbi:hypothetical protein, partial [uncultured Duncaniella sp.]|uniref:hypothetical protein n=1 Tax=uncultured Duncaniella sp. TaxID=2768039 RepID=UPI00266FA144
PHILRTEEAAGSVQGLQVEAPHRASVQPCPPGLPGGTPHTMRPTRVAQWHASQPATHRSILLPCASQKLTSARHPIKAIRLSIYKAQSSRHKSPAPTLD